MNDFSTIKEDIRQRLSLSSIIGARVKLTRAGREHKGCCPFHTEKSPSFFVNDDKGFYHCFGCGAHGDHFGFVMALDKLSFYEAMEQLAGQAGVAMPKPDTHDALEDKRRNRLHHINDEAALLFESLLHTPANHEVLTYLRGRGLSEESLRNFRLGYAPQDGSFLVQYLLDKGFDAPDIIDAGLARESEGRVYSFFRDRVMFPVSDRRGRIIAFGGRVLPATLRAPNDKAPKYLNTSDTPLFNKSQTLYAQALARQAGADGQTPIVVEGYTDVIALHQHGFKSAVAPLGTALTETQIEMLWSMDHASIKEPILAFDGDKAGRSAALRAADRALPILKPGHSLRILFLPEGEDPDTLLLKHGPAALRQLLQTAQPLVDFLWEHWRGQMRLDTPEAQAHARAFLRDKLEAITNTDVKIPYKQDLSARLNELLQPRIQSYGKPFAKPRTRGIMPKSASGAHDHLLEQVLMAGLLICPQLVEHVEETLGTMELNDNSLDKLRQFIISESSNWAVLSTAEAAAFCEMKGFGDLVTELLHNRIRVHTGFVRGAASVIDAAAGWIEAYERRENRSQSGAATAQDTIVGRLGRYRRAHVANDALNDAHSS